jgi:hypothetical protein
MKEALSSLAIGRVREGEDLRVQVERLARQYPTNDPIRTLLARCGDNLAEVMTG